MAVSMDRGVFALHGLSFPGVKIQRWVSSADTASAASWRAWWPLPRIFPACSRVSRREVAA